MSTYAIGDLQGCYEPLLRLLEQLRFDSQADTLWFVGDLVNRGPQSLACLRLVKQLGDAAVTVLGNHDLHLLAMDAGIKKIKPDSTLKRIIDAPDRAELLHWLRMRPLLHRDDRLGYTMTHAGLLPQWDYQQARDCAREAETLLHGDDYRTLLEAMYGDSPHLWSDDLRGWDRIRMIINGFTRMRYCDREGRLDMDAKGPPGTQPTGLVPWFEVAHRKNIDTRIVFGHWSALGYHRGSNVIGLDSGCVWGEAMTAINLEATDPQPIAVDCKPSP